MVKLLSYKMLRDMRRSMSSYLVAALVVAAGFAGYSVLSIAAEQLEASKEYFFEQTSFAHAFAEVHAAPLAAARALMEIDGVAAAQGRLVQSVRVARTQQEAELKVISVTPGGFNRPLLSQGILPQEGQRQIVLGDGFAKENGLSPGDSVALHVNGRETTFSVTGTGLSPENIYLVKSINELLPTPATYDAAFLDYGTMAGLLGMQGRANNFVLTLEPGVSFDDVQGEIERVLEPYGCYRTYAAKDELSVSVLEMEIEQLGKMTGVIPFLFLGIAAIILYITLHRMIEQQRTQIGTLMALGLTGRTTALHYTGYGGFVGLMGGLAGGVYGSIAAGPMADFYRTYFSLPKISAPISLRYLAIGAAVATVFCALVSGLSVRSSSRLVPAEALRPAPPKTTRRSLLERIPGVTSMLTVPGLTALRSLGRNPRRSALSLFGIACAYMITATLVSMNSMFDVFLFDYLEKNQQQDITVAFSQPVIATDAQSAVRSAGVERAEGIVELPVKLRGKTDETDGVVQGIPQDSTLCRLYDERGAPVRVQPEGIVISVHMAQRLGVGVGDTLEVEVVYPQKHVSRVTVTGVIAQYLGSNVYMSLEGVGRISEYRGVYTSMLLKAPQDVQAELLHRLDGAGAVATVQNRLERVQQYRSMMGMISGVMAAMAVMGVLIGFAVVYTGSLISFEELKRELAVMRTLGLSDAQCMQTVSLGGCLLTAGGVVLGMPMTMLMSRFISNNLGMEMFTIPDFVDAKSLILSIGLIAVAALLSNRAVFRRLRRTTPVELLRERE